ncbi:MAG TPA: sugar ABC transporter ATP-binding protein [Bryobacteraceae bacterium]|jgi:rhamnose transport system ATP-binding protein
MVGPLIEAKSIWKSFDGVTALKGVSFELLSGEVHALVGENGAGKSTLIKIITGAVVPDSGTLTVAGTAVAHYSPALARSLGIAAIYQQPALFPHLTVAENIAWGGENRGLWRRIDAKAQKQRALDVLSRVGAQIDPERLAGSLTMPEQQMVEIAKAIGAGARILILDEPTASLADREVDRLFQTIAALRAEGHGMVYISHRLDEVFAIADRVTVLRDGETVATRNAAELNRTALIERMVGRSIAAVFPKRKVAIGETVLEVRNISCATAGLHDISLAVRKGEILGIAGLTGSGRTELAETIFGLRDLNSGEILVEGRRFRAGSTVHAIRAGLAYVPEDRRRHGVVPEMAIAANTTLASLRNVSRCGWLDTERESALAGRYVDDLQVKTASVRARAATLSGGNQQKVAVARWLATGPKVLILDEPTQGVDVGAKSEIHRIIGDLAERGLAIMMISSELPEVLGMSDRIAVMHAGSIAGILPRSEATQQKILTLALGHAPNGEIARVAE